MRPRLVKRLALTVALVLAAAGCAGPAPSLSPAPTIGPRLSLAELRYVLVDELGRPWYCDPDEYPVGRDELASMRERWPEVTADAAAFEVIIARLGLQGDQLDVDGRLAVYRDWKVLNAIVLEPVGNGHHRFDYLAAPVGGAADGTRTAGLIDERGKIEIEQQAPAGEPNCPICLDGATAIDTPAGPVAVSSLRFGMPIWTTDAAGRRLAGTVLDVRSLAAPPEHRLVHLVLDDGRELRASPGHPLADGRLLGELRVGDAVDGTRVVSTALVASGDRTWDVLPSGETGDYWAHGVPLRSTLHP